MTKSSKVIVGLLIYFVSLIIALPFILWICALVPYLSGDIPLLLALLIYTGFFISLARRLLGFRAGAAEGGHATADVQPAHEDTPRSCDPGAGLAFGVGRAHVILRVVLFVFGGAGTLFGVGGFGAAVGWWRFDSEYLDGAAGWLFALSFPFIVGVVIFSRFVLPTLMARSANSAGSAPSKLMAARAKERSRASREAAAFGFGWLVLPLFVGFPIIAYLSVFVAQWLFGLDALADQEESFMPIFVVFVALLVTLMCAVGSLSRLVGRRRMGRTVLWLRRFHREGRFPFDLVFDDICRGLAVPLTVADTTVPKSNLRGILHWASQVGAWVTGVTCPPAGAGPTERPRGPMPQAASVPLVFAVCVAIASMSGGDRQS